MTAINSVIAFATVPALPFGGVGDSGFGRIHGADGLREFSRAKAITRQRMRPLVNLTIFWADRQGHEPVVTLSPCCTASATGEVAPVASGSRASVRAVA